MKPVEADHLTLVIDHWGIQLASAMIFATYEDLVVNSSSSPIVRVLYTDEIKLGIWYAGQFIAR